MARFNFKGADQGKRVGELSGGERGRLHWRNCCRSAVTSCCSMNQPTTWISKPCARWKTPCWSSRAARWLSRTTAGSLTVLPPTFWITRDVKVRLSSSKVTFTVVRRVQETHSRRRRAGAEANRQVQTYREINAKKGNARFAFFCLPLSHWERGWGEGYSPQSTLHPLLAHQLFHQLDAAQEPGIVVRLPSHGRIRSRSTFSSDTGND